jgi:hypothetical protein
LLSGLWHGAAWTYVIWGLLHGGAVMYEYLSQKQRKKISKLIPAVIYDNISRALVLLFVIFTMVFFRSQSISDSFYIFSKITSISGNIFANIGKGDNIFGIGINMDITSFIITLLIVLLFWPLEQVYYYFVRNKSQSMLKRISHNIFLLLLAITIVLLGWFANVPFVYFQF